MQLNQKPKKHELHNIALLICFLPKEIEKEKIKNLPLTSYLSCYGDNVVACLSDLQYLAELVYKISTLVFIYSIDFSYSQDNN